MRPVRLGPNQPRRFYRGGPAIAAFRGLPPAGDHVPEDWVGSMTSLFAETELGLTRLDGGLLREAVFDDPEAWLGPRHVRQHGANPALLVKLLDAVERLPVHAHPDDDFARRHLDCPFGKTEAWIIVETRSADPAVHLGFRDDVDVPTLARWVHGQEVEPLLGAMHRIEVRAGDAVLVPAGVPHAIGAGILLVELQEPTDLSVLLEWTGFDVDGTRDGHLGLGYDLALTCVDRSGLGAERIAGLRRGRDAARGLRPGVALALPAEADQFFRAERLIPEVEIRLEPGFAILVILSGEGTLAMADGARLAVARGDTLLVPFGAGETTLHGSMEAIRCLPPVGEDA